MTSKAKGQLQKEKKEKKREREKEMRKLGVGFFDMEVIILLRNTVRLQVSRQSIGGVLAVIVAIASSMGDEDCRNNRERGGGMRERSALPIDYFTHISTSDL